MFLIDGSLLPFPQGLKARGAALDRSLNSLLRHGLISTDITNVPEMVWRRGSDWDQDAGHGTGLVINPAGFAALGIEPPASNCGANWVPSDENRSEPTETAVLTTPTGTPRPGGKLGAVIDAIARPEGASLDELTALSGWLPPLTSEHRSRDHHGREARPARAKLSGSVGDLTNLSPVLEVAIGTIGLVIVMILHGTSVRLINRH